MLKNVETVLEKPILYKKTEGEFWNDEHISMQMLKAHLNPEFDGASRKHAFIEESVAWITELVSPIDYPLLFDIGCGPGQTFPQDAGRTSGGRKGEVRIWAILY